VEAEQTKNQKTNNYQRNGNVAVKQKKLKKVSGLFIYSGGK